MHPIGFRYSFDPKVKLEEEEEFIYFIDGVMPAEDDVGYRKEF